MECLERINLSDVVFYERWYQAKLGTLLQVSVDGTAAVGVRATRSYEGFMGIKEDALLIVSGSRAGRMYVGADLSGPAIDVSAQLEIIAVDAAPTTPAQGFQATPGMLMAYPTAPQVYFIWTTGENGEALGPVCVRTERTGPVVGECFPKLSWTDLVVLSLKVDVAFRAARAEGLPSRLSHAP